MANLTALQKGAYFFGIKLFNNHLLGLVVRRSPDRSPVVSLVIFSEASDRPCARGRLSPLEMSTRIFLGVKAAGA
jgi:hypothetical protein